KSIARSAAIAGLLASALPSPAQRPNGDQPPPQRRDPHRSESPPAQRSDTPRSQRQPVYRMPRQERPVHESAPRSSREFHLPAQTLPQNPRAMGPQGSRSYSPYSLGREVARPPMERRA